MDKHWRDRNDSVRFRGMMLCRLLFRANSIRVASLTMYLTVLDDGLST